MKCTLGSVKCTLGIVRPESTCVEVNEDFFQCVLNISGKFVFILNTRSPIKIKLLQRILTHQAYLRICHWASIMKAEMNFIRFYLHTHSKKGIETITENFYFDHGGYRCLKLIRKNTKQPLN